MTPSPRFTDRTAELATANLRARVQMSRVAGTQARLRGRHARMLPPVQPKLAAPDPLVELFTQPTQQDQVFRRAAALWFGNEIAMVITPVARAALETELGHKIRKFAVHNRRHARPAPPGDPMATDTRDQVADLLSQIHAQTTVMQRVWTVSLPSALAQEITRTQNTAAPLPSAQLPRLKACLAAALVGETKDV